MALMFTCGCASVQAGDTNLPEGGKVILADDFSGAKLSSDWKVVSGEWTIEDGTLVNRKGGIIVIDKLPGANFVVEADVRLPESAANFPWVGLFVFYESPTQYGGLYYNSRETDRYEINELHLG